MTDRGLRSRRRCQLSDRWRLLDYPRRQWDQRRRLEARREHFEQRAAISEFHEGLSRAEAEAIVRREMVAGAHDDMHAARDPGSYASALAALRAECPAYVDAADWQQAIEDGHRFVTKWGKQAEALGWAPADLFGLHTPPEKPALNYRRLARYDQTGLIWLLRGRPVIALTENEATILARSGANLTYGRHNKPAQGPIGNSTSGGGVEP